MGWYAAGGRRDEKIVFIYPDATSNKLEPTFGDDDWIKPTWRAIFSGCHKSSASNGAINLPRAWLIAERRRCGNAGFVCSK